MKKNKYKEQIYILIISNYLQHLVKKVGSKPQIQKIKNKKFQKIL